MGAFFCTGLFSTTVQVIFTDLTGCVTESGSLVYLFIYLRRRRHTFVPNLLQSGLRVMSGVSEEKRKNKKEYNKMFLKPFGWFCCEDFICVAVAFV